MKLTDLVIWQVIANSERAGEFAVSVSGNWRIVFRFGGEDAIDVNLEDYH